MWGVLGLKNPLYGGTSMLSAPFLCSPLNYFRQIPGLHTKSEKKDTTGHPQPQQMRTPPAQRIAAQLTIQTPKLSANGQSGSVLEGQSGYI